MVYKYIDLIGSSPRSFADATKQAVGEAAKTVRGIEWVEVTGLRAKVEKNRLAEFQSVVRVAFKVER